MLKKIVAWKAEEMRNKIKMHVKNLGYDHKRLLQIASNCGFNLCSYNFGPYFPLGNHLPRTAMKCQPGSSSLS